MVPGNKILTVTYGTFSCTLEGFEDPFSAMTEIAEYFRDLAAKDRFFGAEPPTPDMGELQKIAASTVPGPVHADNSDGRIVLRPGEAESPLPAAAALADDPAAAVADSPDGDPEVASFQAEAADRDDAVEESAAAKLALLRGIAIDDPEEIEDPVEAGLFLDADGIGETDLVGEMHDADAAAPEDAEADESEDVATAMPFEVGAEAPEEDAPAIAVTETAFDAPETREEADPAPEPVDVGATSEEPPAEEPETVEAVDPVPADEDGPAPEDEDPAEAVAPEAAEAPEEPSAGDEAPSPAIFDMIRKDDAPRTPAEEAASDAAPEVAGPPDGDDSLTADLAALFSPRSSADDAEEPPAAQAIPKPRVTVRKVRKSAPAPEAGEAPEMPAPAAALADDEEADLMAELAAIEAELARDATGSEADGDAGDDADDDLASDLAAIREAADAPAEAEPAEASAPAEPEAAPEVEDAEEADADPRDLERLFAATDSRLSGEDASRRHANISHLKAAVAARRADDTIETPQSDASGAYREDLANTVRPRRASEEPAGDGEGTHAGRSERSAPLVLISEQRVEPVVEPEPAPAPAAAKAPEVDIAEGLSKKLRAPDPGDDFEQFALDVGASDLSDVLEAAAVYSATVMGQDTFSRPRLLHLAAEAVDDLSREDGLRGFGQLLRDGTIRKVGRGTFTLGTVSRFQRDAERRAG